MVRTEGYVSEDPSQNDRPPHGPPPPGSPVGSTEVPPELPTRSCEERQAASLVADWVTTLFRSFPSAGDLDRLVLAIGAGLETATAEADARVALLAGTVDRVAREHHGARHAGLFASCAESPCPDLREAVAAMRPAGGRGPQSA
jgi:hypothetical protein